MTGKDINTKKELQTEETILRIFLQVRETADGRIGIECNFNDASTTTLLEVIPYMLDVAYKGDEKAIRQVGDILPDIVDKYLAIKQTQMDIDIANKEIDKVIGTLSIQKIKELIALEVTKDTSDFVFIEKLTNEIKNRGSNEREGTKEETTNSI
jgi:hypothetical protein